MNTLSSLKCAAVLVPALAIGLPMANASDEECECPCPSELSTAMYGNDRDQDRLAQQTNPRTEQRQNQHATTDRTAAATASRAVTSGAQYVENKPTSGFHSDNLVGHDVKNRRNDETVGTISNLVIDEDGQVVAAILSVGGLMGIGARDVAVSWDQIERNVDGDDLTLTVDLTEDSLNNAPEYSSDRKSTSDRSTTTRR